MTVQREIPRPIAPALGAGPSHSQRPNILSLKDMRTPQQLAQGHRRIDGMEEENYFRRSRMAISYQTWIELQWVSFSYGMSCQNLVNQVISWAYVCGKADPTIRWQLANPEEYVKARSGEKWCDGFHVNWSPEMVSRFAALFARCDHFIKDPWPPSRDKISVVLEASWNCYRKQNEHLAKVLPSAVAKFDPTKFGLRMHKLHSGTQVRYPTPVDDDPLEDPCET